MHESIPNTFESGNEGLNVRDIELWAKYIEDPAGYHEKQVPSERWIINFDSLVTRFETKHNLEELHAIIDLKPEESREHVIREPARLDLILVVHRMNFIRDHTDAVQDKHQELYAKYMTLSRAVGMINNNIVDHTRETKLNRKY